MIISKPGFSNAHKAMMFIDAETKEDAETKAVNMTCKNNKLFKYRNDKKLWILSTTEIGESNG